MTHHHSQGGPSMGRLITMLLLAVVGLFVGVIGAQFVADMPAVAGLVKLAGLVGGLGFGIYTTRPRQPDTPPPPPTTFERR